MNLIASTLTLAGWAAVAYIVLFVDPTPVLARAAFYAALFVALTCTLARLLGGQATADPEREKGPLIPNLGHAAIVSTLALFAMWLQSLRMLTSLNGTLLAAMFLFIELGFFLSRSGRRRPRSRRRAGYPPTLEAGLAGER